MTITFFSYSAEVNKREIFHTTLHDVHNIGEIQFPILFTFYENKKYFFFSILFISLYISNAAINLQKKSGTEKYKINEVFTLQ